jgi:drug/metabolite transporter (DMT)-like permease
MHPPIQTIVPLLSAGLYAVAAIALKRATGDGAGPWRVAFVTNCLQALVCLPLWLLPAAPFAWEHLGHAVVAGGTFFVGQIFTFLALSRGDVSVATPVLGAKVIFVAFFTIVVIGAAIPAAWWAAAVLTAGATALMGGGKAQGRGDGAFARSLLYGFSAATAFALTDVLTQKWAPAWGFAHFAPVIFVTVGLLSFLLIPHFRGRLRDLSPTTWAWLIPGAVLLSAQAAGVAYSIMNFGAATRVNILYASRGVWTVVLVWGVGHWFGNEERARGHGIMARRLCGSLLLLSAIILVLHSS